MIRKSITERQHALFAAFAAEMSAPECLFGDPERQIKWLDVYYGDGRVKFKTPPPKTIYWIDEDGLKEYSEE